MKCNLYSGFLCARIDRIFLQNAFRNGLMMMIVCFGFGTSAQGLTDAPVTNLKSFTPEGAYTNIAKLKAVNSSSDFAHPDFGKIVPGAKSEWVEQYGKRTFTSRSFIAEDNQVAYEYSNLPINYKDAAGNYIAINSKLSPGADNKGWSALHQEFPTYLNPDGSTEITLGKNDRLKYNLNSTLAGKSISVKNFTVGDDGMIIYQTLPGVDKKILFGENRIETDYILNSPLSNLSGDLVLSEEIVLPAGYTMKAKNLDDIFGKGKQLSEMIVVNDKGQECAHFKVPYIYDASSPVDVPAKAGMGKISSTAVRSNSNNDLPASACFGKYNLRNENGKLFLDVIVSAEWLNAPARAYPVTIDPVVTGPTTTWAGGTINSCFMPNFNMATIVCTVPGNMTITNFFVSASYYANPSTFTYKSDGFMYFTTTCGRNPSDTSLYWTIQSPNTGWNTSGTAFLTNQDMTSTLACCLNPSCIDQSLSLTMHLGRNYGGATCNATYVYYDPAGGYPFQAYIVGRSVQGSWSLSPLTVCSDVCNMTLNATANYGVPPYTMTHPWSSSSVTFGTHTANSCTSTGTGSLTLTNPACPTSCGAAQSVSVPAPTITDACGTTVSGLTSKTITVNPKPVLTATPNSLSVCPGDPISIVISSCVSNSTITWTGSNSTGGSNNISGVGINSGSTPVLINYTAHVTSPNGCIGDSIVVPVTVNPNPVITASPASSAICVGQSLNLTATGGITYTWSPSAGLNDPAIGEPVASPTTNTTYTVNATDANGCKGSASLSITINPPLIVTASPASSTICSGQTVNLTATGGTIYNWAPSAGLSDPTIDTPVASPTVTTIYTVNVSDASGCSGSATLTIDVNSSLNVTISPDTSICLGGGVQISAGGGTIYSWLSTNGLSDSTISNPVASPTITTIYTALVSNANGCFNSASVTVNVSNPPSLIPAKTNVLCYGQSNGDATINPTGSSPFTYAWSNGATTQTASSLTAGTYTVTVTDSKGCISNDVFVITEPAPLVLNFKRHYYICDESGTVQLTASGGTSYSWSPGADLSDSTIADPLASPFITTTYLVTVANGTCSDTAHVTVHLISAPPPPTITRYGDTLAVPPGYTSYQWYYSGSPISGATNSFYQLTQDGLYSVYLTDTNGCRVTTQGVTFVEVNSINPNNSGILIYPNPANEEFTIEGLQLTSDAVLKMYNVLGEIIYSRQLETGNRESETINISSLANGVYFLQINSKEKTYTARIVKE